VRVYQLGSYIDYYSDDSVWQEDAYGDCGSVPGYGWFARLVRVRCVGQTWDYCSGQMMLSETGHCMLLEAADDEPAIKQGIMTVRPIIAILSTICIMMGNKERKMI
jgi:hypothetical protein